MSEARKAAKQIIPPIGVMWGSTTSNRYIKQYVENQDALRKKEVAAAEGIIQQAIDSAVAAERLRCAEIFARLNQLPYDIYCHANGTECLPGYVGHKIAAEIMKGDSE